MKSACISLGWTAAAQFPRYAALHQIHPVKVMSRESVKVVSRENALSLTDSFHRDQPSLCLTHQHLKELASRSIHLGHPCAKHSAPIHQVEHHEKFARLANDQTEC